MPSLALGLNLDKLEVGFESGAGGANLETFAGVIISTFAGDTITTF